MIAKKGKDLSHISGHRPISLMNYDAKIYAKALAKRLKSVCNSVIGTEQLAYVEGRLIKKVIY